MPKYIYGLTGPLGSGCTTTADYLEKKGCQKISISKDILAPLAKVHSKPFSTRKEKQDFGNFAREHLKTEFKENLLKKISEAGDEIVIECFRNPIEIDFLRDEYPHFYLFALYAHKDKRSKRKIAQGESDFEKCDKRDQGEKDKYGQQVRKCVTQSDIVLNNSYDWRHIDDADAFFERVDDYRRLLKDPYRKPTHHEMNMHLAYSVSLHSLCIQRQVGAVITDGDYQVLSVGFNDAPPQSESCFELYSQCYRKMKKKENLVGICKKITFCPFCGHDLSFKEDLFNDPKILTDNAFFCSNCKRDLSEVLASGKELDLCRSLHAEENAILSNPYLSDRLHSRTKGMIIFTTTFPCMLCAKKIAKSGIKRVIFVEPYPVEESQHIFNENGIEVEIFEGVKSLSFNWIFRKRDQFIEKHAHDRLAKLRNLNQGA